MTESTNNSAYCDLLSSKAGVIMDANERYILFNKYFLSLLNTTHWKEAVTDA